MQRRARAFSIHHMTLSAVLTALLCLLGPVALPLGPVPLSLFSAGLMLAAMLTGPRIALTACGLYLLLGLAGLPVFGGFQGGVGHLAGPTGGFLLGYLPLTALCGLTCAGTAHPVLRAAGFAAGTALLYAIGTAWYCMQAGVSAASALAVCVLPFLPGDALKIAAVLALGPCIQRRMPSNMK